MFMDEYKKLKRKKNISAQPPSAPPQNTNEIMEIEQVQTQKNKSEDNQQSQNIDMNEEIND